MKNLVAPLVWVDLGITFDGLDNHGCFLKIPTNTGIVILHETSVSNFTIFEIQSFSRDKLVKNLIEIVFLSAFMRTVSLPLSAWDPYKACATEYLVF